MKLLFVNLYPSDSERGYLLSSYVLKGYLEAYSMQPEDLDVEVSNYSTDSDASLMASDIIRSRADVVGFSCYVWNVEKIGALLKHLKPRTDSCYVLGGPEISLDWIGRRSRQFPSDYYVIGPGERILLQLVDYLRGFGSERPAGAAFWSGGALQYTEPLLENQIAELDEIPSIYLNEVIENDLYEGQEAYLETQRGCRYRCKYCVYHKNLDKVYSFSLNRVFRELHHLIEKKQVLSLRIFDSIFTNDLERAKAIIRYLIQMKEDGVQLPYLLYWELMYNGVDEEFFQLTAQLKYRQNILNTYKPHFADVAQHYSSLLEDYTVINCIGLQSLNKESLRAVHRVGVIPRKLDQFMSQARQYNVVLKVDLILGLPFETYESYLEGLNTILPYFEATDHILNIHRLQILPGSEMEEVCRRYEVEYSMSAPHYVHQTREFSRERLILASALTAVLFRVLNSTLRPYLYRAVKASGLSYTQLIEELYAQILHAEELGAIAIVGGEVNDMYWNEQVFQDLPSEWLISRFENYVK